MQKNRRSQTKEKVFANLSIVSQMKNSVWASEDSSKNGGTRLPGQCSWGEMERGRRTQARCLSRVGERGSLSSHNPPPPGKASGSDGTGHVHVP